jgi:hypothetical protein
MILGQVHPPQIFTALFPKIYWCPTISLLFFPLIFFRGNVFSVHSFPIFVLPYHRVLGLTVIVVPRDLHIYIYIYIYIYITNSSGMSSWYIGKWHNNVTVLKAQRFWSVWAVSDSNLDPGTENLVFFCFGSVPQQNYMMSLVICTPYPILCGR